MRIRESKGVITAAFVKRPKNTQKYVGLFTHPDGDNTNDFLNSNGTFFNTTKNYTSVSQKYEALFDDVGQSWMIRDKSHSLFKNLNGHLDFDNFYFPEYRPSFAHFPDFRPSFARSSKLIGNGICTVPICQNFTGFLRESCCFDYAVTNDTRLVEAIMVDAEKEEDIQKILNNTIPTIKGGVNQTTSVGLGDIASFAIQTFDENGDNITASLVRNDGKLFKLFASPDPGLFNLEFSGTSLVNPNTWKAQVSVSDGIGPVLFTASVYIPPLPCADDREFRQKGKSARTCSWISKLESRRQKECLKDYQVREACPITCGTCCADDAKFRLKLPSGDKQNCDWIGKKDSRITRFCGGKTVRNRCRMTCSACFSKYLCVDNNHFKGDDGRTCRKIGMKESRRVKYCRYSKGIIRGNNCPVTCGRCCDDNPDFLTKLNGVVKKIGCEWIAQKPSRINQYCSISRINRNCPSKTTCNTCKTLI